MAKPRTDGLALWERSIRRGALSLVRERDWLTAFGALTGVFLLLQIMIFALLGTEGIQNILRTKTNLTLEIIEGAPDIEVQRFLNTLQQQPYVQQLTYITKEQAYAQMKQQDPELITFLEDFNLDNPFPETVAVTLRTLQSYEELSTFVRNDKWHSVVDPAFLSATTDQEEYIYDLLHITGVGQSLVFFFLILTIVILLFITTELVRERVLRRSEEVLVEHLSGAMPFSILLPFAIEASLILGIAILGSMLLMTLIFYAIPLLMPTVIQHPMLKEIHAQIYNVFILRSPMIIGLEIAAIPVIGWLGAWLGMLPKLNPRKLLLHRH